MDGESSLEDGGCSQRTGPQGPLRLLFAREGCLYRLEPERKNGAVDVSEPQEVADLRGYVFENRLAPPAVTQW